VFLVIRRILAAPEERQQLSVAPAFVARGGPGVVVALQATHVEQAVKGTGTPQDLETTKRRWSNFFENFEFEKLGCNISRISMRISVKSMP